MMSFDILILTQQIVYFCLIIDDLFLWLLWTLQFQWILPLQLLVDLFFSFLVLFILSFLIYSHFKRINSLLFWIAVFILDILLCQILNNGHYMLCEFILSLIVNYLREKCMYTTHQLVRIITYNILYNQRR